MRASKGRSPDEIRERYLGEIAPLLEAARKLDSLTPVQKTQVRRRVLRTVFGGRARHLRFRLTPVMVGLGLLVAGGVAFATAERLGFIHRADQGPPNLKAQEADAQKRKVGHSKHSVPQAEPLQAAPPAALVLPAASDPLSTAPAPANTLQASPMAGDPVAAVAQVAVVSPAADRPAQSLPALVAKPIPSKALAAPPAALSGSSFSARPSQAPKKIALGTPYLAEPGSTATTKGANWSSPSVPALTPAAYLPAAPGPAAPAVAPPPVQPHSGAVTPAPSFVPAPQAAKPVPSDSVLFGQALRKLRNEDDPAAALAALQQHAQSYPRSAFTGERNALEVEALLALHRDREALQKLDGMSLENLPRSGERFVVRGELRAAAKRWVDAQADFDRALSRVSGSPRWHERALWGRGVARLRCGDRGAGMSDIEQYHDLYPQGRFAGEASRFFPNR